MYAVHSRVTMSGYLGFHATRPEIFSTGFSLTSSLAQAPPNWETAVAAAITGAWSNSNLGICQTATLTMVKISKKLTTGKDDGQPVVRLMPGDGVRGGAPDCNFPYQIARVVSLNAASATRHAKGRLYLPSPSGSVNADTGTTNPANEPAIAQAFADLIHAVQVASGELVVVASKSDGNHPVTAVRVGNVLATMRTRRDKLKETYSSVAL